MIGSNIEALGVLLGNSKRCAILSHINPDGDAVGSSLGFWSYLQKTHPELETKAIFPNRFPEFLAWMPLASDSLIYAENKDAVKGYVAGCNLIMCLDFNNLYRIEELGAEVKKGTATKILIDHHPQPSDEFDLVFSNTAASSTCELVYKIIVALGGRNTLTKGEAEALYVGILTDTGSFNHSVNSPEPFRIAADLMELGIDKDEIASKVFEGYSGSRLRLLGYCLSEKMQLIPEKKAAYMALSREELERFQFKAGDAEGFVNYPLSIKGIEVTAFFYESLDRTHIRVSLRSKGKEISVNELARKYFNGGGHFNAAGGKYFGSLKNCCTYFENVLKVQSW
ncbi:MAG: bifunctional oligoribonuclease/PAP phosphatase NrnA [Prevotellaceae bacterium]|nr:bifunctional oligoribonuclease/PAP phosphatase NrnA [Prevotellaceae bacterium]